MAWHTIRAFSKAMLSSDFGYKWNNLKSEFLSYNGKMLGWKRAGLVFETGLQP